MLQGHNLYDVVWILNAPKGPWVERLNPWVGLSGDGEIFRRDLAGRS